MHLYKPGLYTTRTAFHHNLFCVIIKHMEDNQCNPAPTSNPHPQFHGTAYPFHSEASCGLPAWGRGVPLNVAALSAGQSSRHLLTVIFVHSISPPYVQSSVLTSLVQFQTFDSQIWISTDVTLS